MGKRRFYPPTESDIPMHGWQPYSDMHRERIRAHEKHDKHGGSMERLDWQSDQWLRVVIEEVGEVAHEMTYDSNGTSATLRKELVQVGAMVAAWIEAIDLSTTEAEDG